MEELTPRSLQEFRLSQNHHTRRCAKTGVRPPQPALSESDLEDTLEFLKFAGEIKERIDASLLEKLIAKELQKGDHRINRLKSLLGALEAK